MFGIFQHLLETFLSLFIHQWRIGIFGNISCKFVKNSSVPACISSNLYVHFKHDQITSWSTLNQTRICSHAQIWGYIIARHRFYIKSYLESCLPRPCQYRAKYFTYLQTYIHIILHNTLIHIIFLPKLIFTYQRLKYFLNISYFFRFSSKMLRSRERGKPAQI